MPAPLSTGTHEQPYALLDRPLQFIQGVGPKRAELLLRLLLENIRDLLYFFPIAHKDRASVTPIARLRPGAEQNVRAQIVDVWGNRTQGGKEFVCAMLQDESSTIEAMWWNPYLLKRLSPMAWAFFSGKVAAKKSGGVGLQYQSPEFEMLTVGSADKDTGGEASPQSPSFGRIVPIYSLRPKIRRADGSEAPEVSLTQAFLRKLTWSALEAGAARLLPDELPAEIVVRRKLLPLFEAVRMYHFPTSMEQVECARRRLAYEELFALSLGVALRRAHVEALEAARKLSLAPAIQARIDARLPFKLTAAQARAFREIAADMGGTRPMNRLLQGDVGSGKTAVALSAMLLAVAHGAQTALLAPTEVLAEQHLHTFTQLLTGSRVKVGLLRGGVEKSERTRFLKELADGAIHIAIGTHALLEPDVHFKNMALVVIDEQHKFGVEQRRILRGKGPSPHVLVMTATPIPRSLSLTLYGDLDISSIDSLPPGRGEITTRWMKEHDRPKVYKLILKEARVGHATYIVLPRIESGDIPSATREDATAPSSKKRPLQKLWSEVKGVEEEVKRLREQLPTLRIESLHGRMKAEQKESILRLMREGQLDVLVSTQVIEVGIDMPNATLMVIENAERFGLSSLHQLRGRVGRSALDSYCLFFAQAAHDEAKERLQAFASTRDGFQIAETDFRLRGPGKFFGTEQSGLPELVVADLPRDQRLLMDARDDAIALVRSDPTLKAPQHATLHRRIKEKLVQTGRLGLIDVG